MKFPIPTNAPIHNLDQAREMMQNLSTDPLKNSGVRVVNPVGDGSSGVLLIGEAPGQKEDEQGEPFVGASGKFLNNTLLPSVGLSRANIYLTNIVKCRPPQNRDPLPEEKEAWSPVLLAEILAIKPKLVVCLGRHSLSFFFPDAKIGQVHGKVMSLQMFEDYSQLVLPVYHPAVALYNPSMREKLLNDFKVIDEYRLNKEESSIETNELGVSEPKEINKSLEKDLEKIKTESLF
jgi:uracil-DNA glycosylase